MKRRACLFAVLVLIPGFCAVSRGTEAIDLSGTWKMDPARSESAHQAVPIGKTTMVIKQTPSNITIETHTTENGKSAVRVEIINYRLDGSETTTDAKDSGSVKSKAHWDGTKLITETERSVNGAAVTTRYIHSLEAGGKELKVEKTLTVQHGYQFEGSKSYGTGTDVFVKVAAK